MNDAERIADKKARKAKACAKWRASHKAEDTTYHKGYYVENREAFAARSRKSYEATKENRKIKYQENKAAMIAYQLKWKTEKPEMVKAANKKWRLANPGDGVMRTAMRAAAQKKAKPVWVKPIDLLPFYKEASRLTRETGIRHEVDHIVPLQSKLVCGLHCHANLRVITEAENIAKGNRWWPDMLEAA